MKTNYTFKFAFATLASALVLQVANAQDTSKLSDADRAACRLEAKTHTAKLKERIEAAAPTVSNEVNQRRQEKLVEKETWEFEQCLEIAALRADTAALRADTAALRAEGAALDANIAALRAEGAALDANIAALDAEGAALNDLNIQSKDITQFFHEFLAGQRTRQQLDAKMPSINSFLKDSFEWIQRAQDRRTKQPAPNTRELDVLASVKTELDQIKSLTNSLTRR